MPDHIHGILWIMKSDSENFPDVGVQNFEPQHQGNFRRHNLYQHIIPHSIGCIVRGFKIGVTKWFREKSPGMVVWQRNYYEHIIKNEDELMRIRKYIVNNPSRWTEP